MVQTANVPTGLLAAQEDVEADLGRDLTDTELVTVTAHLVKASALTVGYLRRGFDEAQVPVAVRAVVAGLVGRAFGNAESGMPNAEQLNAGPFAVRYATGTTSNAPYLSSADKMMLRPYRRGGGIGSVQLVGERHRDRPDWD